MLHGKTQPLPPPSVAAVLKAAQSSLESHLSRRSRRRRAGTGQPAPRTPRRQQQAAAELTELARRLEAVQTPMFERLRAYEQRIAELERNSGTIEGKS